MIRERESACGSGSIYDSWSACSHQGERQVATRYLDPSSTALRASEHSLASQPAGQSAHASMFATMCDGANPQAGAQRGDDALDPSQGLTPESNTQKKSL